MAQAPSDIEYFAAPGRRDSPPLATDPAPDDLATASIPSPELTSSQTQTLVWSDIAGETVLEQAKSVLAVIGFFAVLFILLRKM